ncbi:leucine-rich repeat-containing protein 71-like isoform X2 [Corticium candelabrum]|uniref:leucine-rich repeat-containing protein 71-like isoform X2 n=1 Tax=Corticium candelabrum TaxID=121492 RepID=UPI002E266E34|nr:leucine-rich repeat-containing protein 71-like isoform X2 [Corticium candelabrum]
MTKKDSRTQKAVDKGERTSSDSETNDGLTGYFVTDFPVLCEREGIYPISVVPRSLAPPPDEEQEQSVGVVYQPNRQFFLAKILADIEEDCGKDVVKAIHLRGWLLEERILNALSLALPSCSQLTTIKLWNVGLTEQTFSTFTSLVIQFHIKHVALSGNPIDGENYSALLSEESSVEKLSLHGNGLSDRGAELLGEALSPYKHSLLLLDLSHNRISSDGTKHLARALRMNRSLLSLSLANNKVDDEGAVALSEVVSRFPLNRHEIVARRMFNSDKRQAEDSSAQTMSNIGASISTEKRQGLKPTASHDKMPREKREKTPGLKKRESKRDERGKKDDKDGKLKKALGSAELKKGKGGKVAKKGTDVSSEEVKMDVLEHVYPITENVEEIGGKKYILGNRALTNINLSYNAISEEGISALLKAVQFQSTLSLLPGAGLMRLSVQHNNVSPHHEDAMTLQELMLTKDPFYKPPDSESVSTTQDDHL